MKPRTASRRARATGSVLIVLVGLLNFHIPHFLIQSSSALDDAGRLLELVFVANVLAAVVAAVGIYRGSGWAWLLGLAVVAVSVLLYLLQETMGLPGLPKAWLEPSRIVSLLLEASFACIACYQLLVSSGRSTRLGSDSGVRPGSPYQLAAHEGRDAQRREPDVIDVRAWDVASVTRKPRVQLEVLQQQREAQPGRAGLVADQRPVVTDQRPAGDQVRSGRRSGTPKRPFGSGPRQRGRAGWLGGAEVDRVELGQRRPLAHRHLQVADHRQATSLVVTSR